MVLLSCPVSTWCHSVPTSSIFLVAFQFIPGPGFPCRYFWLRYMATPLLCRLLIVFMLYGQTSFCPSFDSHCHADSYCHPTSFLLFNAVNLCSSGISLSNFCPSPQCCNGTSNVPSLKRQMRSVNPSK